MAKFNIADVRRIGRMIDRRDQRCPYNPFPPESSWGRKLEEAHRIDQAEKARRRAALASGERERDR